MNRDLLPNITPIEAGPVVIDDHMIVPRELIETYITCEDIAIQALSHGLERYEANLAMLFATRSLINHLGLQILPPYEATTLRDGEVWGPYDPSDYYIYFKAFAED